MCVRSIDCVSVSVILGLGFGTVLTLLCVVCHFITLFDHWILTITLRKTLCTRKIISPFRITLFDFRFAMGYLMPIFCFLCWFTLTIVCILLFFNAWSRDCLSLLNYDPFCHFLIHKTYSDLDIKIDSKCMAVFDSILLSWFSLAITHNFSGDSHWLHM
jgi:hypothetical protein